MILADVLTRSFDIALTGEDVVKPHHPLCGCTTCLNRKEYDPLMHSLSIINAYRALCSEAYISLTSEDPILTAFLLSKELDGLCRTEKEFKVSNLKNSSAIFVMINLFLKRHILDSKL